MKTVLVILIFFSFAFSVYAQADNPINARSFPELLLWIARVFLWASVFGLPIGIISAGVLYLTAPGNPNNIVLAKKIILYCAVFFGTMMIIKLLISAFAGGLTFTAFLCPKNILF